MNSPPPPLPGPDVQGRSILRIVPVNGRRMLRHFLRVPWRLYATDPSWIPPLMVERREHVSRRNPFFKHARIRLWIAYRDAIPVGRISAQIDMLHLDRYKDATGFFGMLEAEDDEETFKALFAAAETWLRNEGMRHVWGPFNFSINQECGLLVDGYEHPPMIMMGHAPRYYAARVEALGYSGIKDTLAYRIRAEFDPPTVMQTVVARVGPRVRVRPLRRTHFHDDTRLLQDIFNDAWSDNWGYVPFTSAEFAHLAMSLKFLVDDDFVQIAEVDGYPAAMIVALPNVNEAIRDLNGRIFPFGWMKLLWRLKVAHPRTVRIPLMGVRKQYHRTPLGMALAFLVIDALRAPGHRRGITDVELSWILEENYGMRNILEAIGGVPYKRYRIYRKDL